MLSIAIKNNTINAWYIVGLVEGEGYLGIGISKKEEMRVGYQVYIRFGIDMNVREKKCLQKIKNYFNCGTLYETKKANRVSYYIRKLEDINNIIIPFFEKYEFQGGKIKDFNIIKKTAKLMQKGYHLTPRGFNIILKLKSKLHKYIKNEESYG